MIQKRHQQSRLTPGFTLIELMIVMVIMGILVGIGAFTFRGSQSRGRDSKRKSDLQNVATALESYYSDKSKYPTGDASGQMVGCGTGDSQVCSWGGAFTDQNGTIYMSKIPVDSKAGRNYFYASSGTSYQVYARLDNTDDNDVPKNPTSGAPQGYSGTNCGGSVLCNYGIASTNTTPSTGRSLVDE